MPSIRAGLGSLLALAAFCLPQPTGRAQSSRPASPGRAQSASPAPVVTKSPLDEMLDAKVAAEPNLSDEALAAYANQLLAQYGYNYRFDACEALAKLKPLPKSSSENSLETYLVRFARADGRGSVAIRAAVGDAPCGECMFDIPARGYANNTVEVAQPVGKSVRVRLPKGFGAEQSHALMDASLKKVIRRWNVPEQSVPIGVSADGRTLYLYFSTQTIRERLALALDEKSRPSFVTYRSAEQTGEEIKEHPQERGNDYLSFIRFRVGKQTRIVRYSAPCA